MYSESSAFVGQLPRKTENCSKQFLFPTKAFDNLMATDLVNLCNLLYVSNGF